MKKFFRLILIILIISLPKLYSQNYNYTYILVDTNYDKSYDTSMKNYIDSLKNLLDFEMNKVIGYTDTPLYVKTPQSELSNLLTDIVFKRGNEFSLKELGNPVDLSLLNFGGIREHFIDKGEITVGDIYTISPFDNTLVIIELTGIELRKVFSKFTAEDNQPYANAKVLYQGNKIASVTVNGEPINYERTYYLATLDFIANGGDNILTGIVFKKVTPTHILLREAVIGYITSKKNIKPRLDDRVTIQ